MRRAAGCPSSRTPTRWRSSPLGRDGEHAAAVRRPVRGPHVARELRELRRLAAESGSTHGCSRLMDEHLFVQVARLERAARRHRCESGGGASKVFGEALGRLYGEKYGLEVVCVRIGSFAERPRRVRQLSTWLSPRGCLALFRCCIDAPVVGFTVVYGVSANSRSWLRDDSAASLGYRPKDSAEEFSAQFEEPPPAARSRPADRLQGGSYVEKDPGR